MTLEKFYLYANGASRLKRTERKIFVSDVAGAVAGAFSKGLDKYMKALDGDGS